MQTSSVNPHIRSVCRELFFRQSFIKDYMTCGMMSLFRWVLNIEESQPFFAALLGTAGHSVIYQLHEARRWTFSYEELMRMFEAAFRTELAKVATFPKVAAAYSSIDEQLADNLPYYTTLLFNYQADKTNHAYYSTIHEQSFVLSIQDSESPTIPPYIFTGQIDQGGFYEDGTFTLRDIKFRDNAFRPSRLELDLDFQMSIYACAIRLGKPACPTCKPHYVTLPSTTPGGPTTQSLVYDGPCQTCAAKIGTSLWPSTTTNPKLVERCELVWMRDYEKHTKDQFPLEIINNQLPKIPNPAGRGPRVFPRIRNPKYDEGYKIGDYKGPRLLKTYRSPAQLEVLMSDILGTCAEIRAGHFHRKPGDHCNFWCKYAEQCKAGIEMQVQELDLSLASTFATEDPF